jgi:hypothetical protein
MWMSTDGLSRSPDDILSDIRISRDEITCAFTATEIRVTDREWDTALDFDRRTISAECMPKSHWRRRSELIPS